MDHKQSEWVASYQVKGVLSTPRVHESSYFSSSLGGFSPNIFGIDLGDFRCSFSLPDIVLLPLPKISFLKLFEKPQVIAYVRRSNDFYEVHLLFYLLIICEGRGIVEYQINSKYLVLVLESANWRYSLHLIVLIVKRFHFRFGGAWHFIDFFFIVASIIVSSTFHRPNWILLIKTKYKFLPRVWNFRIIRSILRWRID